MISLNGWTKKDWTLNLIPLGDIASVAYEIGSACLSSRNRTAKISGDFFKSPIPTTLKKIAQCLWVPIVVCRRALKLVCLIVNACWNRCFPPTSNRPREESQVIDPQASNRPIEGGILRISLNNSQIHQSQFDQAYFDKQLSDLSQSDYLRVRENIRKVVVNQEALKLIVMKNFNNIESDYPPGLEKIFPDIEKIFPAIVIAEKTRIYFNNQGIPVSYTTQNFEGFTISILLKFLKKEEFKEEKGLKFFTSDALSETMLQVEDYGRSTLCTCSNLFDSTHGESHNFFLMAGTQSLFSKSKQYFKNTINQILDKAEKNTLAKRIQILNLYEKCKAELSKIEGEKLLYTVALIDRENNAKLVRLSKPFGDKHEEKSEDINSFIINCNGKTELKSQEKDCPQLRILKPTTFRDSGIRMFRCYSSQEQEELHKKFKIDLQNILYT